MIYTVKGQACVEKLETDHRDEELMVAALASIGDRLQLCRGRTSFSRNGLPCENVIVFRDARPGDAEIGLVRGSSGYLVPEFDPEEPRGQELYDHVGGLGAPTLLQHFAVHRVLIATDRSDRYSVKLEPRPESEDFRIRIEDIAEKDEKQRNKTWDLIVSKGGYIHFLHEDDILELVRPALDIVAISQASRVEPSAGGWKLAVCDAFLATSPVQVATRVFQRYDQALAAERDTVLRVLLRTEEAVRIRRTIKRLAWTCSCGHHVLAEVRQHSTTMQAVVGIDSANKLVRGEMLQVEPNGESRFVCFSCRSPAHFGDRIVDCTIEALIAGINSNIGQPA